MNCQDVTEILDNHDLARLSATTRGEIEKHAATCSQCAGEWEAFARFAALPEVVPAPGFASLYREVVASSGRPPRGRRVVPGSVVVGALLALAAAATMLVHFGGDALPASVVSASQDAALPVEPAAPGALLPVVENADTGSPSIEGVPVRNERAPAATTSQTFTVRVLPLASHVTEDLSKQALDAFYAALLGQLRAVSGLTLVNTPPPARAEQDRVDFELAVKGDKAEQGSRVRAQVRARRLGPNGLSQAFQSDFTPSCINGTDSEVGACFDASSAASGIVGLLRDVLFPTDQTKLQVFAAQLADPALDPAQRREALGELAKTRGRPWDAAATDPDARNPLSSPDVVRGAIALAGVGNPSQRAAVWRTLRGAGHPDLIDPLVSAARFDAESSVRKEAVVTLAGDFASEARSRQALETVAQEDASPFVRALAQRAVEGESAWRAYVSASLQDIGRPASERAEALLHHVTSTRPRAPGGESEISKVLDEAGAAALGQVLPEILGGGESETFNVIVSRLGGLSHPAITDALLTAVDFRKPWFQRRLILNQLVARNRDPRVRAALERIAENDPDVEARETAARALTPRSGTP